MLAISTLLDKGTSYKNAICLGHVLDEKGKKMSKSKGNIIDPMAMMDKFGADATRWLFYTVNGPGDAKRIGERNVQDSFRKFILILWNINSFFTTYANIDGWTPEKIVESDEVMDKWIDARVNGLIKNINLRIEKTEEHPGFDIVTSARRIQLVVNEFSTWYLRRSRKRRDNKFYSTMYKNLFKLSRIIAPFVPFVAEEIYQALRTEKDPESVHLCDWPKVEENKIDENLIKRMETIRRIVALGHAIRAENNIKLRQPLGGRIIIYSPYKTIGNWVQDILLDELNLSMGIDEFGWVDKKENMHLFQEKDGDYKYKELGDLAVGLNINISDELKIEGISRDIIREIQQARKEAKLSPDDKIKLYYQASDQIFEAINKFSKEIKEGSNCFELINLPADNQVKQDEVDYSKEVMINDQKIWIGIKK